MVSLVETIAKSLVSDPDAVTVTETKEDNNKIVIQLKVAQEDMSKIIGRQGRIAKALRTVVKAAAVRKGVSVVVEIVSTLFYYTYNPQIIFHWYSFAVIWDMSVCF